MAQITYGGEILFIRCTYLGLTLDNLYKLMAFATQPCSSIYSAASSERLVRSRPMLMARNSAWRVSGNVKARWRKSLSGDILRCKYFVGNDLSEA